MQKTAAELQQLTHQFPVCCEWLNTAHVAGYGESRIVAGLVKLASVWPLEVQRFCQHLGWDLSVMAKTAVQIRPNVGMLKLWGSPGAGMSLPGQFKLSPTAFKPPTQIVNPLTGKVPSSQLKLAPKIKLHEDGGHSVSLPKLRRPVMETGRTRPDRGADIRTQANDPLLTYLRRTGPAGQPIRAATGQPIAPATSSAPVPAPPPPQPHHVLSRALQPGPATTRTGLSPGLRRGILGGTAATALASSMPATTATVTEPAPALPSVPAPALQDLASGSEELLRKHLPPSPPADTSRPDIPAAVPQPLKKQPPTGADNVVAAVAAADNRPPAPELPTTKVPDKPAPAGDNRPPAPPLPTTPSSERPPAPALPTTPPAPSQAKQRTAAPATVSGGVVMPPAPAAKEAPPPAGNTVPTKPPATPELPAWYTNPALLGGGGILTAGLLARLMASRKDDKEEEE